MLLAEAIKEKDYITESILDLEDHIRDLMVVKDKTEFKANKTLVEGRMDELKELYKKYQQFSVTIERAKAKTSIKVNDTKLSLLDAMAIKNVMGFKLSVFDRFLRHVSETNRKSDGVLCVEADELFREIELMKLDIKTLDAEIEYALWNVEVS